jgi:acetoin utilization protein AcuB
MLIKDWMSKSPVTIDHKASLDQAAELFRTRVISMLPVMDDDALVGVVTDGDIKRALPSKATTLDRFELRDLMGQVKINTIMSSPVISINWDSTVDQAARLMLSSGISGLPVMENGTLAGVITKSDVFRCFVSFTGVAKNGQIFGFTLKDKAGSIKEISQIICGYGGRLSSILTSYDDIDVGYRNVFFHTYNVDPDQFETLVTRLHGAGKLTYVADLSRGLRRLC